jgi:hypothetical protein
MKGALSLFVLFGALQAFAQKSDSPGAPAKNVELKLFTREGPISLIFRGSEVTEPEDGRLNVIDLNITSFSGKADRRIDGILLSPKANFYRKEERAAGDESVRFIRDEMEVTGAQWTYEHALNKVTIHKNARVVFHAELPNLLR